MPDSQIIERPSLIVGEHVKTQLDFVFGRHDHPVQITQAWSFQKGTIEDVATEVKAWGYALARVQEGRSKARIEGAEASLAIADKVPVEELLGARRPPISM